MFKTLWEAAQCGLGCKKVVHEIGSLSRLTAGLSSSGIFLSMVVSI